MRISYKAVETRRFKELKTGELFRYLDIIYMITYNVSTDEYVLVNMKTGQARDVHEDLWDEFVEVVEGTLILECYE